MRGYNSNIIKLYRSRRGKPKESKASVGHIGISEKHIRLCGRRRDTVKNQQVTNVGIPPTLRQV